MGDTEHYVLLPVDDTGRKVIKKPFVTRRWVNATGTTVNVSFLLASIACLAASAVLFYRSRSFSFQTFLTETSINSPAAKALNPNWSTVEIHVPSVDTPEGVYHRAYSAEVEAAWVELANPPFITLTEAEVRALGKDPATAGRAPMEWGVDPDLHLGMVDVHHQLHCLNIMRRTLQPNYGYYHKAPLGPMGRTHVSHCLSMLKSAIMCQPSLDILTTLWTDNKDGGPPDHTVDTRFHRKCWDYSELDRWTEGRRVDVTEEMMMMNLTAPAGTKVQPPVQEVQDALAGKY